MLYEKSEVTNAMSRITKATIAISASEYIARRPEWIQASSWRRAPWIDAPMPYRAHTKPRTSRTRPAAAISDQLPSRCPSIRGGGGLVLGRALGGQRVALPDVGRGRRLALLDVQQHGAALRERIGNRAVIGDRHRHLQLRITDAEGDAGVGAAHAAAG